MNNTEKIQILNEKINNYLLTIKLVEQGIIDNPTEKSEKVTRKESINDLKLIVNALLKELDRLNQ
jgi:beta-N-acetylglucosaminidase